nr:hypothetical protein [Snodgrassella alvi]
MLLKNIKLLIIGILVTGCAAVDNQKPDELVRQAIQRNITRDNQYNLSGQLKFKLEEKKNTTVSEIQKDTTLSINDTKTLSLASDVISKNTANVSKNISSKPSQHGNEQSSFEEVNERNELAKRVFLDYYDIYIKRTAIPFTGAVDLPKGKIEWIPEIYYEGLNKYSSIKIPSQLDFKNKVLTVDMSAFQPRLHVASLGRDREIEYEDKSYFVWNIPKEFHEKLPFNQLIRFLPKAIDDGLASLDKENFVFLDMDDRGRKLGAKYLVRLTTNEMQSKQVFKTVLDSIIVQLQQDWLAKNNKNNLSEKPQEINYEALREMVLSATEDHSEDLDSVNKIIDLHYNMTMDFYINKKDQLIAINVIKENDHFHSRFEELVELFSNKKFIVNMWIQFQNKSSPDFIMKLIPKDKVFYSKDSWEGFKMVVVWSTSKMTPLIGLFLIR